MEINREFFSKYNIDEDEFQNTGLDKEDLIMIYEDYIGKIASFKSAAAMVVEILRRSNAVHSIKYRIKDPEHLIEKIIRKRIDNQERVITVQNYNIEITDLIGIRVLHLFKNEWIPIHEFISENWDLHEMPTAYIREGDSDKIQEIFKELKCDVKIHDFGYRSVHYLIKFQPQKEKIISEIQVRTIFEEGWSEIDHEIRYPYSNDNPIISNYLEIFNRLAGSADEMGTFVKHLDMELKEMKCSYANAIKEKNDSISDLEDTIQKLEMESDEKDKLLNKVKKLENRLENLSTGNFSIGSISGGITLTDSANSNSFNDRLNKILNEPISSSWGENPIELSKSTDLLNDHEGISTQGLIVPKKLTLKNDKDKDKE